MIGEPNYGRFALVTFAEVSPRVPSGRGSQRIVAAWGEVYPFRQSSNHEEVLQINVEAVILNDSETRRVEIPSITVRYSSIVSIAFTSKRSFGELPTL